MSLLSPLRPTGLPPGGGSSTRRIIVIGAVGCGVLLLLGLLVVPMLIVGGTSLLFGGNGAGCTGTVSQPKASSTAGTIPSNYLHWYKTVGQQYGIPWTILAGIGTEESDNGQTTLEGVHSGSNAFGAAGPMQIGIGGASGNEWGGAPEHPASEVVDGVATDEDGDGVANVYDPADAIAGAAKYLINHGARTDLSAAIFAYNHATWYVQAVERYASQYAAGGYTVDAAVTGCSSATSTSDFGIDPNTTVTEAIAYAEAQLGKPYLFGGTGPDSYDCSGLVMMAYRAAGVYIPRTSQEQWIYGPRVNLADVEPGDLVFFAGSDGTLTAPGHVGLVISKGKMIEAYATGFAIRISTYGTPTSPPGDQVVVGFTRPWSHPQSS
jgi:cell wall-associated NlpC family hydrolase